MTVVQSSPTIGSTVSGTGSFSVTLFAQNTALQGSTNTCNFTVNKVDNTLPSITCPSNISQNAAPCTATVTYTTPSGTDNCTGATTTRIAGLASGAAFPVGTTTVTHRVTDGSGNSATCSFAVTVTAPEMEMSGNSNPIADNSVTPSLTNHTDFGSTGVGVPVIRTYTITNSGTSNLTIGAGAITMSGTDASMFVVGGITLPASIVPTGSTSFTVTFTPTSSGAKTATVNIANNDCDENPYNFAVQGTGIVSDPDMNVKGNSVPIADNDLVPTTADHSDFGSVLVCSGTIVRTFTIENISGANLTIGTVSLTGTHASDFLVNVLPGSPVVAGNSTTFQVTFNPSGTGLRSATIEIANNDPDENPYNFAIQGTGNSDIVDPTITCPANISVPATLGFCTATATYTAPVGADNCGVPVTTQIAGLASGATYPGGVTTNTFRATDGSGNTATCSFTVTVTDNQAPVIGNLACNASMASGTAYNDGWQTGDNDGTGFGAWTLNASTGNTSQAGFFAGSSTVNGAGVDSNGDNDINSAGRALGMYANSAQATQATRPILGVFGNGSKLTLELDNGFIDPGQIVGFQIQNSSGSSLGEVRHRGGQPGYEIVDAMGITPFPGVSFTDEGIIIEVTSTLPGQASIKLTRKVNGATQTLPMVHFPGGGNQVIARFMVFNSNAGTGATNNLYVNNMVACIAALGCPGNVATTNQTGTCGAPVSYNTVVAADNCAPSLPVTRTTGLASGATFPVGITTNAFLATDGSGNTATCSFTVTVTDNQLPTITCPANATANTGVGVCTAVVNFTAPVGADNCSGPITVQTTGLASGGSFPLGVTTNTFRVTDASGNSATCSFTVTVSDLQAPNAICQNLTLQLNGTGTGSVVAAAVNNGSNDACGISTMTVNGGASVAYSCANIGANNVTLLVTDVNGNTATCTSVVTVADTVRPTAICRNVTAQLNGAGLVLVTGAMVNNGSTDACGVGGLLVNGGVNVNFGCANVGTNNVILRVTDVNGNSATCTSVVTVADTIRPVAICRNVVSHLNSGGTSTVTGAMINNGSSDACGIATLTLSTGSFACINVGSNSTVLTVTDVNGNTATCTGIVSVLDSVRPVATCRNITVLLNGSGNGTATAAAVNNGSSDACGIASLSLSNSFFNCSNIGANSTVLTVTDINGNTSTCASTITVVDAVAPNAVCQNLTLQLNAGGNASLTATMANNGSSDACGIASLVVNTTSFGCANVGPNNVVLTVTDVNGNSSTCTSIVTVRDTIRPVPVCQNVTSFLNGAGTSTVIAAQVNNGSSDACGIASLSLNNGAFTCANVGANTVVMTVTDNNGNTATCSATVTVNDTVDPVAVCRNVTLQLNAGGTATLTASMVNNGSADACGVASLSINTTSFACANVGPNSVVLTVTDVNGNSSTCSSTITVADQIAPVAICQNLTLMLNNAGTVALTGAMANNGSSDACGIASLNVSTGSFSCANVGPNNVVLTVTDVNGNTSTCSSIVTVQDTVDPMPVCQNITSFLSAGGSSTVTTTQINNGSSDACGIATLSLNNGAFSCANVGPNTVVLTVTDVNGNTSTCSSTVTVVDSIDPVAVCRNVTVQLNAGGNGTLAASQVNNGSADACGIASLSINTSSFTCANVGPNSVVLTVTDANGNSSTCSSTITVADQVAPVAICQNLTLMLNNAGTVALTGAMANNGSSDACGIASLNVSTGSFSCANVGTNSVVLTVTDVNGNSSTCTSVVTVQDTVDPMPVCQNRTSFLNSGGNSTVTAAQVNNGSSDACGIATLSLNNGAFTCANVGPNTVVLTVTDVNGNTATCSATVTVVDSVDPVAVCQNVTVQLNAGGNGTLAASQVNNGSADACGIATLSINTTSFTCANVGPNSVVLTVTDVNGNSSTCSSTITVADQIAPVAICQNLTLMLNNAGTVALTGAMANNGSSDACGIASLNVSTGSFTCANVGSNNVVLTVTDVNGNSSTCTSVVTVQDTVDPMPVCQNLTSFLNGGGTSTVTAAQVNNGSSDACGIATLSLNNGAFTCANVGPNTVVLTVTDVNGNSATCSATVTVVDSVDPVAVCQNVTVQLNAGGNGTLAASQVNNGSADACGVASLSINTTSFTCANVGPNSVVLTVTDVNGNSSTCSSTITVADQIAPVAVCQNLTLMLNNTGTVALTGAMANNGSSDACGIASLNVSTGSFSCANVGSNSVVLTVTDVNGNSSTCTSVVTVQDTVDPMPVCQNLTSFLNGGGTSTVTAAQVNNGSSDACGIATLSLNNGAFTCANVGPNTVVLTVTDVNGNSATCSATVTVVDSVDPVAVCQNVTVQLNAGGNGTLAASQVNNGSADACGVASLSINTTSFTCANVGPNSVVLTVTDVNGNSSTCSSTITVADQIAPVAVCQNLTLMLNNTGTVALTGAMANNGSSDACGIASLNVSTGSFGCANVGSNSVVLTVTDVNGNSSTCTSVVTVQDTVDPMPVCQNLTSFLNGGGNSTVTAAQVNNGSSDACGIATLSLNNGAFTCANVGPNMVVLTVTDVNGNSATCSATVTVVDTIDPVTICQNINSFLDGAGNSTVTPSMVNNGSNDACGVSSTTINNGAFTCANVGANTVVLTVVDVNGNSATCASTVTVIDSIDPTPLCQNLTVYLDSLGSTSITTGVVNNGSSDICGISNLSLSVSAFNCSNVGGNTVVLTVTDVNANTATCSATVSVLDTIDPAITCPGNQVLFADSALCGAIAQWNVPNTLENCAVDTVFSNHPSGAVFPIGTTTVVYSVIDVNANSSICAFTITVDPVPLQVVLSSPLQGCGYHLACALDSTANIVSYVSGGCLPYSYIWSTGDTSVNLGSLPSGTYFVTVTDSRGTTALDSLVITAPALLQTAISGDTVACEFANTASLLTTTTGGQDCAAYSFLWSTGATTGNLASLPAGTYVVTVTDSLGCVATDTAVVQLGIIPSLDLGPDTLTCPGIPVVFEAPALYAAYQWSTGSSNSVITMQTPGMYICQIWTLQGCTDTDTVNLLEHVVDMNIITALGNLLLCDGDTLLLQGDAGLSNYNWSTGGSTQTIAVAGFGGPITLTAVDTNGCLAMDTVNVNYVPFTDPQPVIAPGPTAPICIGGTRQLDVQSGYFSYAWSTGATSQTIVVNAPGVYIVTVSNGFGCTDVSDPVTVYQVPLPTPTVAYNSGTLSTTVPYVTYQWLMGGIPIPGAVQPTHLPIQSGWYSVAVTDSNGCEGFSTQIFVNPVGVTEELQGLVGLTIYPNPSRDVINLKTINAIDWPVQVEIWDMFGQKVRVFDMAHLIDVVAFDLSDLASAPYLMKITAFRRNTTEQTVFRFVKQ
ncbi:MAG: HYR domain-containing protein [Bacteroidetes bacterium]|nr:HYR domain-containing protein [Bacteroidota bacterium]